MKFPPCCWRLWTAVTLLLLAAIVSAVVSPTLLSLASVNRITQADYDKIDLTMTLADVEAIFGRSADACGINPQPMSLGSAKQHYFWAEQVIALDLHRPELEDHLDSLNLRFIVEDLALEGKIIGVAFGRDGRMTNKMFVSKEKPTLRKRASYWLRSWTR